MANQYSDLYSDDLVDKIIDLMSNSHKSIRACCTECGISYNAFKQWIKPTSPTFHDYALTQYTQGKDEQKQYMFEEINRLTYRMAELLEDGSIDPQIASAAVSALRVQVDALKWELSKLDPKKYGDKLDVTSDNKAITIPMTREQALANRNRLHNEV